MYFLRPVVSDWSFPCYYGIIMDMHKIDKVELKEIIESYGLNDLVFDTFKQVEPDTTLYIFHDKDNKKNKYCLMASD